MQDYDQNSIRQDQIQRIIDKQNEQDEKLAYILNNQNAKLDALMKKIKKSKWSKVWTFFRRLLVLLLFMLLFSLLIKAILTPFANMNKIETINYKHTAVIDIYGEIGANTQSNAETIIDSLKTAVENSDAKYVILNINSPGGSPVQSAYVYEAIMRLKSQKPIYALISDLGASGAYYIASAATQIYAHKSSLVGSIGVISMNFGVKELMQKLGIEARITTAGENKAFMNQFEDINPEQEAIWQELLDETHNEFITDVKNARGGKLSKDQKIFSGLIFTGKQGKVLGLVDELGSLEELQSKLENLPLVNYTHKQNIWDKLAEVSSKASYKLISNLSEVKLK